jgi:hypothetical protein
MSALKELTNSLVAVKEIIKLEATYSDPPPLANRHLAYGLRGAATVLTLASFEAFLGSLFEKELDRIIASGLPLRDCVERLRVEAIFSSLDLAM